MADVGSQAQSGNNGKGNGQGATRINFKERDIQRINEGGWTTISRQTPEARAYANLLTSNDFFLKQLRMSDFEGGRITYDTLKEFIARSQRIKEEINQLNIDLSKALGKTYKPPRGFVPAVPGENEASGSSGGKQKKRRKKKKSESKPVPENLPSTV